jgi:uncharacterized membrane protein
MDQYFDEVIELVVWVTVGAILVVAAVYVIGKFRAGTEKQELKASQLLSKFRELHSKGAVNDAEYRTIKTTLSAQLREELKHNDKTD